MIAPPGEFILEYRKGPPDTHFSATLDSARAVHDVMTKWALDLPGWRDHLTWTPVQY
jgi:hypothetical protein